MALGSTSLRQLPPAIEDWWTRQAMFATDKADAAEALEALEPYVRQLSDLFTTARPDKFIDYGQDAKLRAAYGCFFFPQSYIRAAIATAELLDRYADATPTSGTLRILDLGAGLGACGLGIIHALRTRGITASVELVALDHSQGKLQTLRTLAKECLPETVRIHTVTGDMRQSVRLLAAESPFHLVICGFALNEVCALSAKSQLSGEPLMLQLIKKWRRSLCPAGPILVLEPALEATSRTLASVSNALLSEHTEIRLLPYYGTFPDPLSQDRHHWSHEVRTWSSPESLRYLNRHLWRSIELLKWSCACWIPSSQARSLWTPPQLSLRLVSPFALLKGRFIATAVNQNGEIGTYDLPTRGMDKQTISELESIERGDTLQLSQSDPLGSPNTYRIPSKSAISHHYQPC